MIRDDGEYYEPSEPSKPRKCCGYCGKPITGPLWKRWCSDACKMKAYRERRRRKESVTTSRNG